MPSKPKPEAPPYPSRSSRCEKAKSTSFEAFASDLNPVACLILKVLLEDIPRHGVCLAEELRRIGSEVKRLAENDLAEFYPPDPDGSLPIAYLWARTVRCERPECGAEIPLVRSQVPLTNRESRNRSLSDCPPGAGELWPGERAYVQMLRQMPFVVDSANDQDLLK